MGDKAPRGWQQRGAFQILSPQARRGEGRGQFPEPMQSYSHRREIGMDTTH